jgi:PAS domain S-box-containing protein
MCVTSNLPTPSSTTESNDEIISTTAFATFMNAAFDAGFLVKDSGEIEHWNNAAETLFEIRGDPNSRKISNPLHISSYVTLVDGEDSITWEDFLKGISENPERCWTSFGWRTGGLCFAAELQCAVISDDESSGRVIALFVRKVNSELQCAENFDNMLHGLSDVSKDPVIFVNEKGRIRLVNGVATGELGYSEDEFVGNNISMIVGGENNGEQQKLLRDSIVSTEYKLTNKHNFVARRKDATEFSAELHFREVETGDEERLFCGFLRDCTFNQNQAEELKKQADFTNKIIDASYISIFVADRNGDIKRVNSAAAQKFNWTQEELCQKSMAHVLSCKDSSVLSMEIAQFLNVGIPLTANQEIEAIKRDGATFPASMAIASLENNDSFVIYVQDITTQKHLTAVEVDRTAADMLLSNLLPEKIVRKLKQNPSHIAEHHDAATTLFADIVGFTRMSSQMTPQQVVAMLNELFKMFDFLVEKYDLNKIKTIGDCYMVSTVPIVKHDDNDASRVCYFALEMLDAIGRYNANHPEYNLDLRIGINTGPAMAGVVGSTRFLYDIWGDSVNVASRMESNGIPGKIQVTKSTVDATNGSFEFDRRGIIEVKGKGEVETFFLGRTLRRPSLRKIRISRKKGRRRSSVSKYSSVTDMLNSMSLDYHPPSDDGGSLDSFYMEPHIGGVISANSASAMPA